MSPKSRGRHPRSRTRRGTSGGRPQPVTVEQQALRAAHDLATTADPLDAWVWASMWTGRAWAGTELTQKNAERQFVAELCELAVRRRPPHARAAVQALGLVAQHEDVALIDDALHRLPPAPAPEWTGRTDWTPTGATCTTDVWGEGRILTIEMTGAAPVTLIASIDDSTGHMVELVGVLPEDAAQKWLADLLADDGFEARQAVPVEDALADLAEAMRFTDMLWPRPTEQSYVAFRSLAWTLARDHLRPFSDWTGIGDTERAELTSAFVAGLPADDSESASFADLFIDYADGYFHGDLLAWGPSRAVQFLLHHVPRKVVLDAEDVAGLPSALKTWVGFALRRRGVAENPWIAVALEAIDDCTDDYHDAMADTGSWGIGKQFAAYLDQEHIDLTDQAGVESAMSAFNARQLALRAAGLQD